MNAETSSVIATLIFNGAVGGALSIIFEISRIFQTDIYAPNTRKVEGKDLPNAGIFPFSWVLPVLRVSDEDMIAIAGMDAYVHLRFIKLCFRIVVLCTFFGSVILCPLYATSLEDVNTNNEGITLFSMANIPQGSKRLWAPWICAYLFTFIFLYCIHKEYENFAKVRVHYFQTGDPRLPTQQNYSVLVENIPTEYRTSPKLKELFESFFGDCVACAHVATILTPLDSLVADRKALLVKLEGYIAVYEAGGLKERPHLDLLDGIVVAANGDEQVDAIDYLYDKLSVLNEEIYILQRHADLIAHGTFGNEESEEVKMMEAHINDVRQSIVITPFPSTDEQDNDEESHSSHIESRAPLSSKCKSSERRLTHFLANYHKRITKNMVSSTGFVTFKSRRTQANAAQLPVLSGEFPRLKADPAPESRDIIWNNLSASSEHTQFVTFLTSLMYYVGLVFWGIALTFVAAVSNLSKLEPFLPFLRDLDVTSRAILQGMLPVIVMMIFMLIVQIFMNSVSQYIERQKTFSRIQQKVFKWYFIYQFANVYMLLLAGSVFRALNDIITNPTSVLLTVSSALPETSLFFINFIITQSIGGIPWIYVRIIPLIQYYFVRHTTKDALLTRRTLMEGPLADTPVDYGTTLPDDLYILCVVLLYWVVSPPVLWVSLIYFGGGMIVWKYQYLYVIVRNYEGAGKYWYGLYKYSMSGLLASIVIFTMYMSIKEGAIQAPLLIPLPFIVVMAWRYTEEQFKTLSENVPFSLAAIEDQHIEELKHDTSNCTEDYLKPPCMSAAKIVYPYPYRIDDEPLLDSKGLISRVYLEDLPESEMMPHGKGQHVPSFYRLEQNERVSGKEDDPTVLLQLGSLDESDIQLGVWTVGSPSVDDRDNPDDPHV